MDAAFGALVSPLSRCFGSLSLNLYVGSCLRPSLLFACSPGPRSVGVCSPAARGARRYSVAACRGLLLLCGFGCAAFCDLFFRVGWVSTGQGLGLGFGGGVVNE